MSSRKIHSYFNVLLTRSATLLLLDAEARVSCFDPTELPAFACQHRDLAHTCEKLGGNEGGLWADLLGDLSENTHEAAEVHFNIAHPLIQQAAQLPDSPLLRWVLGILYVQALLLGQHLLTTRELGLLNNGLSGLIADALAGAVKASLQI